MIKFTLLVFFSFSTYLVLGQDVENNQKEILRYEHVIQEARDRGDINAEMINLLDLISLKMINLGDYSDTYEQIIYLQKLIDENPDAAAVKEVEEMTSCRMGWLLVEQQEVEKSVPHFLKAIQLAQKYHLQDRFNDLRSDYAGVLSMLKRYDESLKLLDSLQRDAMRQQDTVFLRLVYQHKSTTYMEIDELDSALLYAKKSNAKYAGEKPNSFRLATIARIFKEKGFNPDSVMHYGQLALEVAIDQHMEREEKAAHAILQEVYAFNHDYEKAYYHLNRFLALEDQQNSFEKALFIGNVNTQKEAEQARLQQALADEQLTNQKQITWIVSIGLVLLIAAIVFITNRLWLIRKQNKIISYEKQRAEQSEQYKDQFLANMSHEIRTPMNAISGMLKILKRNEHLSHQDQYLEAMTKSTDNLVVLLNDILDLSKIEAGKIDINPEPTSLKQIFEYVEMLLGFKAESRGLRLKTDINPDVPDFIMVDPHRLTQVLVNLVGNAIKFSHKGTISLKATCNEKNLQFSISDEGIGISLKHIESIFQSFSQVKSGRISKERGTGLGLTITKQLVNIQGGEIWVTSVPDEGSTFTFTLPLHIATEVKTNITVKDDDLKHIGKELAGLRVLLAEDDEFNRLVAKDELNWFIPNVEILEAYDGESAFNIWQNEAVDLLISDLDMPVLDGYALTGKIRSSEANSMTKTPILAMTASVLCKDIEKCLNAGMDSYVPKPFYSADFIIAISKLVKGTGTMP